MISRGNILALRGLKTAPDRWTQPVVAALSWKVKAVPGRAARISKWAGSSFPVPRKEGWEAG